SGGAQRNLNCLCAQRDTEKSKCRDCTRKERDACFELHNLPPSPVEDTATHNQAPPEPLCQQSPRSRGLALRRAKARNEAVARLKAIRAPVTKSDDPTFQLCLFRIRPQHSALAACPLGNIDRLHVPPLARKPTLN